MLKVEVDSVVAEIGAVGAGDVDYLAHQRADQAQRLRILEDFPNAPAGQRRNRVERAVPHQLVPSQRADARRAFAKDSRALKCRRDRARALGVSAVEFAKIDVPAAQMHNPAGGNQFHANPGVTAHHRVRPENLLEPRFVLNPVLQRQNRTTRRKTSGNRFGRGFGVVSLDAEKDRIVRRELARIAGCFGMHRKVAADAFNLETALSQGAQMAAARA
jgi:hypothetical protein